MQVPSAQDLADALNRRGGWRKATPSKRQGFMALCPNHADKNPSLSVRETENGKLLLHCFATSCTDRREVYRAVEDAMNFEHGFLGGPSSASPIVHAAPIKSRAIPTTPILPIPPSAPEFSTGSKRFRSKSHGYPTKAWCYRDKHGQPLAWVARYERALAGGEKDKMIWPWIYGIREGKRGWYVNSLPEPRPLYNLDKIAANPNAIVQIHEGEKAADAGAQLFPKWIATTTLGGGNAAHMADLSPLHGRKVVICPDNDAAGVEYALHLHELLKPIAAELRIMRLPTVRIDAQTRTPVQWLPQIGADAADYLEAGFTSDEIQEILEATSTPLTWSVTSG